MQVLRLPCSKLGLNDSTVQEYFFLFLEFLSRKINLKKKWNPENATIVVFSVNSCQREWEHVISFMDKSIQICFHVFREQDFKIRVRYVQAVKGPPLMQELGRKIN